MRVELEGKVSDRRAAWSVLGDTDHLNRRAGLGAVALRLEPAAEGAPTVLGEMRGLFGSSMPFVERRGAWVHERWFRQERTYTRSPVVSSRFELVLTRPSGDAASDPRAVVPRLLLELEPASVVMAPAVSARGRTIRDRWQAILDGLPAPGELRAAEPLRELDSHAASAFARWGSTSSSAIVSALRSHLVSARETELLRMRPFAIADRYALDRNDTLAAMLHSVRAGVLELYFSVRCPRCSGEVASAGSLSNIADHADCPSCRVGVPVDLADTVEVLFAPHPSIVTRLDQKFCTMFPSGAPELRAVLNLPGGAAAEEDVELPPGTWVLGAGGGIPDLELVVDGQGASEVKWEPGVSGPRAVRAGTVHLRADNPGTATERVILASRAPNDPVTPASMVAMWPEFRREFGPAALSPNARLAARRVALLFTDLSGSTAMYEALGDARAYGLVRDHFALLEQVIDAHRGMLVKTIGDAVMASFHHALDGFLAASAMRAAFDQWAAGLGVAPVPRLNVGVHVGPALAVSAATGIDWFGRTVNLAARVQASARDGAIVFTPDVALDPAVAAELARLPVAPERFVAELKGIGPVELLRL